MTASLDISPQLWREICRHPEIGSVLGKLAPQLRLELPLRALFVRRFDLPRRILETVGEEARPNFPLPQHAQSEYSETQLEAVLAWCREGRPLHAQANESPLVSVLAPPGVRGDVIVGPLGDEEGPQGVLVLVADDRFDVSH